MMSDRRFARALRRARQGDPGAITVVLETARTQALDWLRTRIPEDAVDDVVQEVVGRVWKRLEKCRAATRAEFGAWVQAITGNVRADYFRRETLGRHLSLDSMTLADPVSDPAAPSPDLEGLDDLLSTAVAQRAARLPATTQDVLWRRVVGGERWTEISMATGLSPAAARMRWERARRALREAAEDVVEQAREPARSQLRRRVERLGRRWEPRRGPRQLMLFLPLSSSEREPGGRP
jgi:RNA polymerase sigma factor (sigma-70 family)